MFNPVHHRFSSTRIFFKHVDFLSVCYVVTFSKMVTVFFLGSIPDKIDVTLLKIHSTNSIETMLFRSNAIHTPYRSKGAKKVRRINNILTELLCFVFILVHGSKLYGVIKGHFLYLSHIFGDD